MLALRISSELSALEPCGSKARGSRHGRRCVRHARPRVRLAPAPHARRADGVDEDRFAEKAPKKFASDSKKRSASSCREVRFCHAPCRDELHPPKCMQPCR